MFQKGNCRAEHYKVTPPAAYKLQRQGDLLADVSSQLCQGRNSINVCLSAPVSKANHLPEENGQDSGSRSSRFHNNRKIRDSLIQIAVASALI